MTRAHLGLFLAFVTACGGALSTQNERALRHEAEMTADVFCQLDGGIARVEILTAHKETLGVLRRANGVTDAGAETDAGSIPCP